MTNKIYLKHSRTQELAYKLAHDLAKVTNAQDNIRLYGVPRGGIPAAYLVKAGLIKLGYAFVHITDAPKEAHFIIDDLIDSGTTRNRYCTEYDAEFHALIDKTTEVENNWYVFPWEVTDNGNEESATDIGIRLLQYIGEDPKRGGLIETPRRFIKAWDHWTKGYSEKPEDILKVFKDGGEEYDQMVSVVNIPFYSKCEHHLADIFGTATISYIPNQENRAVIGLSKMSRLLNVYARRLQVQERLTVQVADALDKHLKPLGVGVHIKARHMCMESRGVCEQGHHTETTALRGAIRENDAARAEFLAAAR